MNGPEDKKPAGSREPLESSRLNQIENTLRQSQTLYKTIIDSTPDLIWSVDPLEFRLTSFNKSLSDYFRESFSLAIQNGMGIDELLPPGEIREKWYGFYKRALEEGTYTIEYEVFSQKKVVLLTFSVMKLDGSVFGISAFGRDITELTKAHRQAGSERDRFMALFRLSPAIMALTGVEDGIVFEANDAYLKSFEYTREEVIGRSYLDLNIWKDLREREKLVEAYKRGEVLRGLNVDFRAKSGRIFNTRASFETMELDGKQYFIGALDDITRERKTEMALDFISGKGWRDSLDVYFRSLAGYLALLLNTDYAFIFKKDNNSGGKLIDLSASADEGERAAFSIWAQPFADIAVRDVLVYQGDSLNDFLKTEFLQVMEIKSLAFVSLFDSDSKGIGLILLAGRKPFADEDLVRSVLKIVSVRTAGELERRMNEEEILRLNRELEARVIERTKQLEAANLELESANKELEAFSYSVSHDLRAPLRHMTGFVNLLRKHLESAIDSKSGRYLDVISDSAVLMGRLIDDILSFSRMSRTGLQVKPFSMNRLTEEVLRTFQLEMQERPSLSLKVSDMPEVTADQTMIRTVMTNLISNALKFTSDRENAEIELGHYREGGEDVFYVKDNGAGFSMKYADKLFGLFQRLHSPKEYEGTGVGLASIRRIINRHGGRTWAHGEEGKGAEIYFTLPMGG